MSVNDLALCLRSCAAAKDLHQGRRIHREIQQLQCDGDPLLANLLLHLYARCGCPGDAKQLFDTMPRRSIVSWNILASAFAAAAAAGDIDAVWTVLDRMPGRSLVSINTVLGCWARSSSWRSSWRRDDDAKILFDRLPERCLISWNSLLIGLNRRGLTQRSRAVLDRMPRWDIVSWTDSLAALARQCDLAAARDLFDRMPGRNAVSWNAIITAYIDNSNFPLATVAFRLMPHWDEASFNALLAGHASTGQFRDAKSLFDRQHLRSVISWTSMITASSLELDILIASEFFSKMPQWNVVSWNAMITAYARSGHLEESLKTFRSLPDEHRSLCSWNAVITAHVQSGNYTESKAVFDAMPARDVSSWNNIAAGISIAHDHCNSSSGATKSFFDRMPAWDVISWNILLTAAAESGNLSQAWNIFHEMPVKNSFSWNAILTACALNGHGQAVEHLFGHLPDKTSRVAWNALVSSYARNGQGGVALTNFWLMLLNGIECDSITFTNVLVACSHLGLAEISWTYFVSMVSDHSVRASRGHFACMVDILARLGRLREAEELAAFMPFVPNYVVWKSVCSASGMYCDMDRGALAAQNAIEMEPGHSGSYLLLANMYRLYDAD